MEKTNLTISGMSCASCVGRVEKALKSNPAVKEASVNLATEKASVTYDAQKINASDLVGLIETAGYKASLERDESSTKEEKKK